MAAYFVLQNRILDAGVRPQALDTMAPFAPEVLVLEERSEVIEGDAPFPRTVIIKFASREAAIAWYNSAEYQAVCCLLVDRFVWPAS